MSFDPRTANTLATAAGEFENEPVVKVDDVVINGERVFLPQALPGLPQYVASANAEVEANRLRSGLGEDLDYMGDVPYQPNEALVYDFHAAAGTAANSAIAGLESFANFHIARMGGADAAVIYNGATYDVAVLRNWTLDDRFGKVLPELFEKPAPTQEPWWPTLRRVQGLAALERHGISDPVTRRGLQGVKSLAQRFCDGEYSGGASMMLQAMAYFAPNWISTDRLAQLPRAP